MSRGARGGAGGRGGGHISSASRLNNGTLPFEVGAELEESWEKLGNSQDLFPPMAVVPAPEPVTKDELNTINGYRRFRAKIRAGPFYLPLNPGIRVDKKGKRSNAAARFNPFEDAPTWSNTHSRKRLGITKLSEYSFVKDNFPKELWRAIGVAEDDNADGPARKKRFTLSTKDKLARFDERTDENGVAAKAREQNGGHHEENDDRLSELDKDEDAVSVQQDDDFEDDEDEMGNDYNAEQYFDGGEDDYEDAGGDEGGDEGF